MHNTLNSYQVIKRIKQFEKKVEYYCNDILDLTFGYPINLHADWMEEYITNIDPKILQTLHKKELKQNIKRYFEQLFNKKDICLTTSASEALMVAIHSCITEKHDEVILLDCGFFSYPSLIRAGKGKPIFAQRHTDRQPDMKSIKACFTDKTCALLITQPENPIGRIFTKAEMEQLCLFCIERKVTLIVDHSFIESSYFGRDINILTNLQHNPFLKNLSWIIIGDTGKVVCLYGMKYGCLITSDNLKELIDNWLFSILFQFDLVQMHILSKILHDHRLNSYKTDLYLKIRNNFSLLESKLDSRVGILRPQATPMVLLDISQFLIDDLSFVERILEEEKIALLPGSYFIQGYKEESSYSSSQIRIAISRPKQVIEEAIFGINRFLSGLQFK